jgi:hypothetical protein
MDAITCRGTSGPIFGAADISVGDGSDQMKIFGRSPNSCDKFGITYEYNLSTFSVTFLSGSPEFLVREIEVFEAVLPR